MKERVFWILLSIIGLSWIANYLYADAKRLEVPVFLDHFVDTTMNDENYLTFYYLTNKDDLSQVNYVHINKAMGYVERDIGFSTGMPTDIQSFRHSVLRKITVLVNNAALEYHAGDGDFKFNEMEVFFSDYRDVKADIGEVILKQPPPSSESDDPLNAVSWGGSTRGDSFTGFNVYEPLQVEAITLAIPQLNDRLTFKLSGGDPAQQTKDGKGLPLKELQFPIRLKQGQQFNVTTYFGDSTDYVESSYAVSGRTDSGETFQTIGTFLHEPYLTQADVQEISKRKRMDGQ
ncbi:hypothetical protein NCCP2222_21470 [Sporosarcina sp. NCCP-2222]|uniref:hypothetical protein n=1 Tax=Sporosarcina sp. NCCP-2222 TaxID=2935073 RepID=UPI0020889C85|nr:hypothetical protein [Sporosarcina sp. NCCP-2222]GKV56200.1 hypothetical protein NCCP2222_21470 [Sporosarcina sp. NCCP-2222]